MAQIIFGEDFCAGKWNDYFLFRVESSIVDYLLIITDRNFLPEVRIEISNTVTLQEILSLTVDFVSGDSMG